MPVEDLGEWCELSDKCANHSNKWCGLCIHAGVHNGGDQFLNKKDKKKSNPRKNNKPKRKPISEISTDELNKIFSMKNG